MHDLDGHEGPFTWVNRGLSAEGFEAVWCSRKGCIIVHNGHMRMMDGDGNISDVCVICRDTHKGA